ncbi:MAG: hypothetical protein Q4E68_02905 [Prevotellaceae bacterium]|nr:hypothetical protein [Prevotellaceae bacterium]
MEINNMYLRPYWEKIVTAQLMDEYSAKGYEVRQGVPVLPDSSVRADLIAENKDERILFEITSARKNKDMIMHARRFAIENGYKFKLISAPIPKLNTIVEFEGLEQMLFDYLITDTPGELVSLGPHGAMIEYVEDVDLNTIKITDNEASISGTCNVEVEIEYDQEDNLSFDMSFPATFDIVCENDGETWSITEVNKFEVDTDSFYE